MENGLLAAVKQLLDQAHLGKIATDIAPGLVLSAAILVGVSSFTSIQVFPYVERAELESRMESSVQQLKEFTRELEKTERAIEEAIRANDDPLKQRLHKVEQRIKKSLSDQETTVAAHTTDWENAGKLTHNLKRISEHLTELLVFSFVLGIILAQVAGGFFYNGRFYEYFKQNWTGVHAVLYPAGTHETDTYLQMVLDPSKLERDEDLTKYYRYLEVAMNMILPVGVFAIVVFTAAVKAIYEDWSLWPHMPEIGVGIGTSIATYGLYKNAREQYVGYFIRKAGRIRALRDLKKLSESADSSADAPTETPSTP